MMKILASTLALVLWLAFGAPSLLAQTDEVINQAVEGANRLQEAMRDPGSFVIERVTVTPINKKGKSNVCYEYRSRNGFGGMNRGEAAYGQHHDLKLTEGDNALGVGWYGCYRRDVTDITNAVLKALKPAVTDAAPTAATADDNAKVKALEKELADLTAKQAADTQQSTTPAPTAVKTKTPTATMPAKSSPCKSIMTDQNGRTTCLDSKD